MVKSQRVDKKCTGFWGHAILGCLVLLFSFCHDAFAAEVSRHAEDILTSGHIRGRLQCENGSPVADAWLYTPGDSFTAVTDGTGSFIMRFVPAGTYTLKISWDNGDGEIAEVIVKPKATTDLGVVKVSCPAYNSCLGKTDGTPCDDDDNCTVNDSCSNGACTGKPVDCSDANQCTEDECAPIVGCTHRPLTGTKCDDGDACTQDICTNGACTVTAVDCSDQHQCTEDRCDKVAGCLHQALNGPSCDDGNACTARDTCAQGICAGTPVDCDDHDQCTRDSCEPASGCKHLPMNGVACDDNNPCSVGDTCSGGVCRGEPVKCDDTNPCTTDSCEVARGCVYAPVSGLPCDDSDPCTSGDTCRLGRCVGLPLDCNDGDVCTDDACLPDKGCVHTRRGGPGCPA